MNHQPVTNLDTFELALLTELKAVVSQTMTTPEEDCTPDRPPHRRHRSRWQLSIAAAAAAALAVALLVPGVGTTPAYAVTGRNNGEVRVKVNRLEGADSLEQALREHGIPADITYLPENKKCAPDRYAELRTPRLTLSVAADWFEVTIPPGSVGKDDTFVLSAAVVPIPHGVKVTVDFGIAHGAVATCKVVQGP